MGQPLAISLPGALAGVLVALVAFAVVIGVCFVVLRLISFVVSGSEEAAAQAEHEVHPGPADELPGRD